MSLELKNSLWRPTASRDTLIARAHFLRAIRRFFELRGILEVETPLLCKSGAMDPYLKVIPVSGSEGGYLQTSPEYAMKRLLAAGMGSIYQLCKAFRGDECGRLHNPEFTILEWYRLDFNHHTLMDEMDAFLMEILGTPKAKRWSYQDLFQNELGFNPHTVSIAELQAAALQKGIHLTALSREGLTRDDWLDLLMTHYLEPRLGFKAPCMIYDYPATQAALAKLRQDDAGDSGASDALKTYPVAERFEVYIQGIELANGYHELTDGKVQLLRFQEEARRRNSLGVEMMNMDERLIEALEAGLPPCAGVALGVDRLFMIKMGLKNIRDAIAFPKDCA